MGASQWMNLGQASRLLGVSPSTLRHWADRGIVHCYRTLGGHRRFTYDEIRRVHSRIAAGLGPQASLPPAEVVLNDTRQALATRSIHSLAWYRRFPEPVQQEQRQLGRQLLILAVQFLARREGKEEMLAQALTITYRQGQLAAQYGLNAAETAEAFWFCCNAIEDVLVPMTPEQAPLDTEHLRLHQELTAFFQAMMQAAMSGYESRPDSRKSSRTGDEL
ncbi:MAG: MerR family DNA-binding transcriptional regulator [Anaerolineae bacterium]|nr:MerR family DNA-binding transcriptional regulator [Anaerolineae bacterium]MDW8099668.1 MerR family DNA-binding transcriptional regulator [Anaerolineae bacterium]